MLADEFASDVDLINDGYPMFEWELEPYKFNGSGTIDDPYQISSKEDLIQLQRMVATFPNYYKEYYIQTNDIDLENESFIPIGAHENKGRGTRHFCGYYNGNEHIIKNLNIDSNNVVSCGLFAILGNGGYIKDLVVYGNISGESKDFGGIAEKMSDDSCIEVVHF